MSPARAALAAGALALPLGGCGGALAQLPLRGSTARGGSYSVEAGAKHKGGWCLQLRVGAGGRAVCGPPPTGVTGSLALDCRTRTAYAFGAAAGTPRVKGGATAPTARLPGGVAGHAFVLALPFRGGLPATLEDQSGRRLATLGSAREPCRGHARALLALPLGG